MAALVAILAGSVYMSWLLFPYLEMRHTIHVMGEGGYDALVVGTSHGKAGIDPAVLEEESGMRAVNACLGNERMVDTYYLVRYAAEHSQDLRCVILEVDPSYWVIPLQINPDSMRIYHEMPAGVLKAQYAFDKLSKEDYRSLFFEWYLYRNQIFNLKDRLEEKRSREYREFDIARFDSPVQTYRADGFMAIHRPAEEAARTDEPIPWNEDNVQADTLEMLDRLREFCAGRGIRLVAVTMPVPRATYEAGLPLTAESREYMHRCMESRGIEYLDYMQGDSPGISLEIGDFSDNDGHMYEDTAAAFTRVLAGDAF